MPLLAVLAIDYFILGGRTHWNLGESAPTRGWVLIPWLIGIAAYQLVTPSGIGFWSSWLHGGLSGGLFGLHGGWFLVSTSASATSFVTAAVLTVVIGAPRARRGRRPAGT